MKRAWAREERSFIAVAALRRIDDAEGDVTDFDIAKFLKIKRIASGGLGHVKSLPGVGGEGCAEIDHPEFLGIGSANVGEDIAEGFAAETFEALGH